MRTAVFHRVGEISIEDCETPVATGDKVLVKTDCCAICTWEQRVFTGTNRVEFPFIGGHEVAGRIVSMGDGVNRNEWSVGDQVVVGDTLPCGDCYQCKTFDEQSCQHFDHSAQLEGLPYHGMGGLSEYMLMPTRCLFKYTNVSPQEASLVEPLSCVVHSVEAADIHLGDYVVVLGCGIMGLLHVELARSRGAVVIVSDINHQRTDVARQLGARYTVDPSSEDLSQRVLEYTNGRKAQVVFDTTPIPSVVGQAYDCVAHTGTVVLYSSIHPQEGESKLVPIDAGWMHSWSIRTIGTANSNSRDFVRAATLVSEGVIDVTPFISATYPVSQVQHAFEHAVEGNSFRVIVNFDG